MKTPKRILICPLNWGLGHAGRCIPIIKQLINDGHEVIIGGNGEALLFLQKEFPALQSRKIPGFTIVYSRRNSQVLKLLLQLPKFLRAKKREHAGLKKILEMERFDMVISDNRYGLWSPNVFSVIISHQLMLKLPGFLSIFEKKVHFWLKRRIEQFNECWVPDVEGYPNLTGDLSHKYKISNMRYIGPLSRFEQFKEQKLSRTSPSIDVLVILSGPEPQRSMLEGMLVNCFLHSHLKVKIIGGRLDTNDVKTYENIEIVPFLSADALVKEIMNSKQVICRAGYTTIMELASLNVNALLIPTPGQTEQEYLVKHLDGLNYFRYVKQNDISVKNTLNILNVMNNTIIPNELKSSILFTYLSTYS